MSDPSLAPLHVVATAGHVDHGKSSLIVALTGIDPDRFAEEKRRGLTIDLGFAWMTLPSGREVGFVDVPGHERFIRNMLAGVGPVRLVLFVVAADEGWKPQSEEHLEIVDVLGVRGGVVALTKRDAVDPPTVEARREEVRERLQGTALQGVDIVACSSVTGEGLDELRAALDAMLAAAPPPESDGRPRQFIDRAFTIRGAGTVVTGTLTGGPLRVGDEAQILPSGHRARIRGLQTHKRSLEVARPVSRVAVNLAGTAKADLDRGDALVQAGRWRPTSTFDVVLWPVRGLAHRLTSRGAYKIHVGAAESDARVRFPPQTPGLEPGRDTAFARIAVSKPLVLDVHDAFVLREVGRRETVAGGRVLDVEPPRRWEAGHADFLAARSAATDRRALAALLVEERGVVRAADVRVLTGVDAAVSSGEGARLVGLGPWVAAASIMERVSGEIDAHLRDQHAEHPLRAGVDAPSLRPVLARVHPLLADPGLADEIFDSLARTGRIARAGATVSLPSHRPTTEGNPEADRLTATVAAAEPTPPTVAELFARGFEPELLSAVCAEGRLVRVSADIVMTPDLVDRGRRAVAEGPAQGISVSSFREALGTSRKFAVPLLEYLDAQGVTVRRGDLRVLRGGG